ncbi:hypothetical protein G3A43_09255 [Paraburkholderia aspalathi]|nr:hypothetical protein [Paraburkholderia aspalathi]MBK3780415.1 hypothetical protein [Paraburkholderia aspalathi]
MSEGRQIYVAKHSGTGLYSRGPRCFLADNEPWMAHAKPTVAQVIEQLGLAAAHAAGRGASWQVTDINEADVWDSYYIAQYQKYLPELEFMPVVLTAAPIVRDTPK